MQKRNPKPKQLDSDGQEEDVPDMWRVTLVGVGIFACWQAAIFLRVKGLLP